VTQPQNNESMPPALQDRGFILSDNLFSGIPVEYSGANPIFAAYVADTSIDHNTIHKSAYSGICLGWGWGMTSYMRNVNATGNSITLPMQKLADGGTPLTLIGLSSKSNRTLWKLPLAFLQESNSYLKPRWVVLSDLDQSDLRHVCFSMCWRDRRTLHEHPVPRLPRVAELLRR
jgi:hypothetical protein